MRRAKPVFGAWMLSIQSGTGAHDLISHRELGLALEHA
jgi:hypothetical protein